MRKKRKRKEEKKKGRKIEKEEGEKEGGKKKHPTLLLKMKAFLQSSFFRVTHSHCKSAENTYDQRRWSLWPLTSYL